MNELNSKILDLFRYLLDYGAKYIETIRPIMPNIVFNIYNKKVSLGVIRVGRVTENAFTTIETAHYNAIDMEFYVNKPITIDESAMRFYITIEGKPYYVPELERVEHAQAINKINAMIAEKESDNLDSVIKELEYCSSNEEF